MIAVCWPWIAAPVSAAVEQLHFCLIFLKYNILALSCPTLITTFPSSHPVNPNWVAVAGEGGMAALLNVQDGRINHTAELKCPGARCAKLEASHCTSYLSFTSFSLSA